MKSKLLLIFTVLFFFSACKKDKFNKNADLLRITLDEGKHQAFTDLIYFQDHFFLVFRESDKHVNGKDGVIKLMQSNTGENWSLVKEFSIDGVDLRDPKFSLNGNDLTLYIHGTKLKSGSIRTFSDYRYHFSDKWTKVESLFLDNKSVSISEIEGNEAWPWRVTWNNNIAYTLGYNSIDIFGLYKSTDGKKFNADYNLSSIADLPTEATIRFANNEDAYFLIRRNRGTTLFAKYNLNAKELQVIKEIPINNFGGPNFVFHNNTALIAGRSEGGVLVLCKYDLDKNNYKYLMTIPSGGDATYPGMVIKENILWISYYSSHENVSGSSIYLSKTRLDKIL